MLFKLMRMVARQGDAPSLYRLRGGCIAAMLAGQKWSSSMVLPHRLRLIKPPLYC